MRGALIGDRHEGGGTLAHARQREAAAAAAERHSRYNQTWQHHPSPACLRQLEQLVQLVARAAVLQLSVAGVHCTTAGHKPALGLELHTHHGTHRLA